VHAGIDELAEPQIHGTHLATESLETTKPQELEGKAMVNISKSKKKLGCNVDVM
jgi:hypothetical protein